MRLGVCSAHKKIDHDLRSYFNFSSWQPRKDHQPQPRGSALPSAPLVPGFPLARFYKPVRDSNGWRQYSSTDLSRLNTIAVLKTLGLSLSQIRTQLTAHPSSLEGILHIQMQACKARQATAEEAIALVEGALNHVALHRDVPIDPMCELVRRLEMNSDVPGFRRLIAKYITSDESQAWSTWWAEHPDDLAESGRYFEAQNGILLQLKVAMDAGADARSPQVGFSLGDPLIHAQFALFIERVNHGCDESRNAKCWHFLRTAQEHRQRSHEGNDTPWREFRGIS